MYSTCIFCHQPLGANEAVEHFPVGRRLAFDAARGRLWVVCRGCGRWNLSPLEERWEAVEACERLYRETRLRVSTENIGLARLAEGLELVRIGQPQRPELAAWRYGPTLRRRRLWHGVVSAVSIGFALTAGVWVPLELLQGERAVGRIPTAGGDRPLKLKRLLGTEFHLGESARLTVPGRRRWFGSEAGFDVQGAEVVRILQRALLAVNQEGATVRQLDDALGILDAAGSADGYLRRLPGASGDRSLRLGRSRAGAWKLERFAPLLNDADDVPGAEALALEMALHDESERRALEGELALLEREWREAEEIAAIADTLTLPARVEEFIRRHRGG